MSYDITRWAWDQTGLDRTSKYVLLALADYADDKGECFPSIPAMAERMGYSRGSTKSVTSGLTTLQQRGLVTVTKRRRSGTNAQTSHLYKLHWKKVRANNPDVGVNNPEGQGKLPDEPTTEPITEPTTLPNAINKVDDLKVPDANSEAADIEIRKIVKGIYEWTDRVFLGDELAEQLNPIYENKYGYGSRDLGHMIVNERYDDRLVELVTKHQTSKGKERGLDYAIAQWVSTLTNDYNTTC